MIEISENDDYCVMETPGLYFYYGYEFGHVRGEPSPDEDVWGFSVQATGDKYGPRFLYRTALDDMLKRAAIEKFDCAKCLLAGLAMYMEDCPNG